jgi:8-oxo-dGTP pyrophosphatase MutT (NUDIX family)
VKGRARSVRPRDAATLVLARGRGRDAEVLMGRREPRDRFMPDVYVFPGGRVDAADAGVPVASELRPEVAVRLERSAHPRRARAIGVAAVRETFEETGLVVGRAEDEELRPDLRHLEFVARAITPSFNPIRYHARFFLADAEVASGRIRSNGELLDLAWVPIPRALELEIIDVTRVVLCEVAARLAGVAHPGVPLIHYHRGAQRIRRD